MKKLLALLLTIALVFSLAACDSLNKVLESFNVDDLMSKVGGNGSSKVGSDGEDGEDDEDEISSIEENQTYLYNLGKQEGFEITFKVNEESEKVIGYKDNYLWLQTGESVFVYEDDKDSVIHCYSGEGEEITYVASYRGNFGEMYTNSTNILFSNGEAYANTEFAKSKKTELVGGKTCTIYENYLAVEGYEATVSLYVEQTTGFVFKIATKIVTPEGTEEATLIEVLSFKTGSEVNIPNVIEPESYVIPSSGTEE